MANIHGLGATKKDQKDPKQEEFSSVGASSATAVSRPTGRDGVDDIISAARNANATAGQDKVAGLITLYANGFILGAGEFRDAKDPKNAAFLKSLKAGEVPAELEEDCRREWGHQEQDVRLNLVDRSTQTFTPPPPKFSFAQSQGQSLGGEKKGASAASFKVATPKQYKLTGAPDEKKTTLQLVLGRDKARAEFSHDATVLDIYQHVMFVTKSAANFELLAGFPPKPLTDPSAKLKDAGLLGTSISMRAGGGK